MAGLQNYSINRVDTDLVDRFEREVGNQVIDFASKNGEEYDGDKFRNKYFFEERGFGLLCEEGQVGEG
jgi:hypothetical protein